MKLIMENWNTYLAEQQFRGEVIEYLAENNIVLTEQQLNEIVNWRDLAKKFATPAALFMAMAASNPAVANDDILAMITAAEETAQMERAPSDVKTSQAYGNQLAATALKLTLQHAKELKGTEIAIGGHLASSAVQQGLDSDEFKKAFNTAFAQGLVAEDYNVGETVVGSLSMGPKQKIPHLSLQLDHDPDGGWNISYQGSDAEGLPLAQIPENLAYIPWTPAPVQ